MPSRHRHRCLLDRTRPSASVRALLQRAARSIARPNIAALNGSRGRTTWREETWADESGPAKYRPQFDQAGNEGQVSTPEQNETVKELAGPSQHLLPASSSAASGTSKLRVSSLKWAVTCSVILASSLSAAANNSRKRIPSQIANLAFVTGSTAECLIIGHRAHQKA